MLKFNQDGKIIRVETGTVILEWDLEKGAQIVSCDLKGVQNTQKLLPDNTPVPNLTMILNNETVSLSDIPMDISVERYDEDDCCVFSTKGRLKDCITVEQKFEVFREGVTFCEFGLFLDDGKTVTIQNAEMKFPLNVVDAKNMRGNYMSRDPYLKQDVTCTHVLSTTGVCLDRHETTDIDHLLPLFGLDLGWEDSRYYSNRVEMVIEDSTSIGGGMLKPTRTIAGENDDGWQLTWQLCGNEKEEITAPFLYRNKWALLCGSAKNGAGENTDPARRNNVLGSRICHVMYPYVRDTKDWPWCSVPLRQTFYQDVQLAVENPGLERVDEAAELGANLLIIHQFWMRNGGSNGEPMADYIVFDPEWFKAFIDKAHQHGMRVGVYVRGTEQYSMYSDFFEKYLQKDLDGIYMDWALPFALGFAKSSGKHSSVYNYFMFTRAMRKRVGENGFLIGHSVMQTYASYACFDATLTGEFSVLHSGLLDTPEVSSSYSGAGCCAVHLIAGNSPDRSLFSSQRSAGFSAGLGYSNHPFMEPGKEFKDCCGYLIPYWNVLKSLGSDPVKIYNPAIGSEKVVFWSDEALHPVIYQAENKNSLVIITNLSEEPVDGSIEIDTVALGLSANSKLTLLEIEGTHTASINENKITVENMPPYFFCAALIS